MPINSEELSQFHCTENYYQSPISNLWFSDGSRYVFQNAGVCGAYWLLDEICFSIMSDKKVKYEEFLVVNVKGSGEIRVDDGNDKLLYKKSLEYIDWEKSEEIRFYIETAECGSVLGKLIMLPTER